MARTKTFVAGPWGGDGVLKGPGLIVADGCAPEKGAGLQKGANEKHTTHVSDKAHTAHTFRNKECAGSNEHVLRQADVCVDVSLWVGVVGGGLSGGGVGGCVSGGWCV